MYKGGARASLFKLHYTCRDGSGPVGRFFVDIVSCCFGWPWCALGCFGVHWGALGVGVHLGCIWGALVCLYVCIYVCMYICMYVMYVCIYVCM